MKWVSRGVLAATCVAALTGAALAADEPDADGFVPLFRRDGAPAGWRVSHWSDVAKPPPAGAAWRVEKGILHGSTPRGTWLVSERQYGDFTLAFEFKLGPRGNSGVGLRFPDAGDPAFDGLEVQLVDARYYGSEPVGGEQLTGSLYSAIPPTKQVYRPLEWNRLEVRCQGPQVSVRLNGELIQNVDLDGQRKPLERGSTLAERPRRGHIGFQELSRADGHVEIRNARIKELKR